MKKGVLCRKVSCITVFLFLYLLLLSYFVLFKGSFSYLQDCIQRMASGNMQPLLVNGVPFRNLGVTLQNWKNPWLMMNLLVNIWLFCPWGFFGGYLFKTVRKAGVFGRFDWILVVAAGTALSLGYELIQLQTGIGTFDVDDVILNGTGTVFGYVAYGIFQRSACHSQSRIRSMRSYCLIQAMGNLTSLTVWTTLCYVCSVSRPQCVFWGMLCGACMSCLLQSRRWKEPAVYVQTDIQKRWQYVWCFFSKLLQIWLIRKVVQHWIPNGLPGLGIACCFCTSIFLVWYGMEELKLFLRNKRKTRSI